jgi:hypothetical protein
MKREEERPRSRFNDDNKRRFGEDRPFNKRELAERNDRERYEEDTNYSSLYERHNEFAKMQAARERKAGKPHDGGKREYRGDGAKREFRGGKPAGDKRSQRAQRFSKPNPNKSRRRNEE